MKTLHILSKLSGKTLFLPAIMVMLALTTSLAQVPSNDLCMNAAAISCGQTVTGSTLNATIDQAPDCSLAIPRYGVWYTFVGSGSPVALSTCGGTTNYDTQIGVYSGTCAQLVCVAGNNNFCGRQSRVTFNAAAGTRYYIWVTGVIDARGNFSLSMSCIPNDECADALPIVCGQTLTGSTTGASLAAVATCGTTLNTAPAVWYRHTGTGQATTFSLCGSSYDTKIGVFTGSCGALTCVTGNDDFCGLQSSVNVSTVAGTTYYILVTGFSANTGNFTLSVTCASAPANDNCAGAITLSVGTSCNYTQYTNAGATASAGVADPGCGNYQGGDVWFRVVVPATGRMALEGQAGVVTDGAMAVYSGSCGALSLEACDDDSGDGLMPKVTLSGRTPGEVLYVRFWEYGNDNNGTFGLCAYELAPLSGSCSCANESPWLTVAAPTTTAVTTISTCTYAGEYNTITGAAAGATYVVTSSAAGDYLTVRSGSPDGPEIACGPSPLTFTNTTAGTIYLHVNTSAACGSQSTCRSTTIACTSCGGALLAPSNTVAALAGEVVSLPEGDLTVGDVFPNPMVGNTASIRVNAPKETEAIVRFMDQMGRQVMMIESDLNVGDNLLQLNISRLPAGTYFVMVQIEGQVIPRRLVVPRS